MTKPDHPYLAQLEGTVLKQRREINKLHAKNKLLSDRVKSLEESLGRVRRLNETLGCG